MKVVIGCLVVVCAALFVAPYYQNWNFLDHSASASRTVRTSDEQLSTAVEHLQAIARITTGIALQTALIDGKQSSDELISELLHLGKVTSSQLTSIDGNRLQKALTSLKDLPNQLVDSGDVKKIEEKLEKMEEVRKLVEKAGGGSEWVGKTEFMAEMEKVKKDGVNLTTVASAHKAIKDWNSAMGNVMNPNTKPEHYSTNIDYLKTNTDTILERSKELDQPTACSPKYPTIENAKKSLDPLSQLIELVEKTKNSMVSVTSSSPSEATDFATVQNNIKLLADLSSSLGSVVLDIQTIQTVLESRESPVEQSLKYPGFTNGFHDLLFISRDPSEWIRQVVDRERMLASLSSLRSTIPAFEKIDNSFESIGSDRQDTLSILMQTVNEVRTLSVDSTTAFGDFWKCKSLFSKLNDPKDTEVQQFIKMAEEMDTNLGKVGTSADTFLKVWSNAATIKQLNDVSGLFVVGNDDAVLNKTIETLRNSTEMQKLHAVMGEAENEFGSVQGHLNTIKQQAKQLIESGVVDTYIGNLSNYQPLFKCLHDFGQDNADLVTSGIGISRKFRTAKGIEEIAEDGEEVVDGVLEAVDTFGGLENALGKMKGVRTTDSDALRAFPEPEKHSEAFGRATQGIRAMKQLLDEKQKADVVIQSAGIIETQLASVSLDQEDVVNLKAVIHLSGALSMMLPKLAEWKNQNVDESSTVLVSYSSLFSSAQNVPGVGGNLWKMSSSVEKLVSKVTNPNVQRELRELQTALSTLASIGTDFSTYTASFTNIEDSLTVLDTFFANYRKHIPHASVLLTNPNSPTTQPSHTSYILKISTHGGLNSLLLWLLITLIVLVIIFCPSSSYVAYFLIKNRKKVVNPAPLFLVAPKLPRKFKVVEEILIEGENAGVWTASLFDEFFDMRVAISNFIRSNYTTDDFSESRVWFETLVKYANVHIVAAAVVCQNPPEQTDPKFRRCREYKINIRLGESYKALKVEQNFFPHDYYHANHFVLPNGLELILAQSPCANGDVNTVEEFWFKVVTENVEFILSLVHSSEIGKSDHYAQYFNPNVGQVFTYGRVVVRCVDDCQMKDIDEKVLILAVSFDGGPEHTVAHFHFPHWPKGKGSPLEPVIDQKKKGTNQSGRAFNSKFKPVLEAIRESNRPVLIHSPHGCGRAGTVAFIELGIQTVANTGKLPIGENLNTVRAARAGAVENDIQLASAISEICSFAKHAEDPIPINTFMAAYYDWTTLYGHLFTKDQTPGMLAEHGTLRKPPGRPT